MKTAHEKYITITRYDLYNQKAIPTGKVREVDGKKQAEFFHISSSNPERKVWLHQEDLSTVA
jgi:hypothetical protein